jgi:hypothetical protein
MERKYSFNMSTDGFPVATSFVPLPRSLAPPARDWRRGPFLSWRPRHGRRSRRPFFSSCLSVSPTPIDYRRHPSGSKNAETIVVMIGGVRDFYNDSGCRSTSKKVVEIWQLGITDIFDNIVASFFKFTI